MRACLFNLFAFGCLVSAALSCSVEDEALDLDVGYLHVSDALEYCQGPCSEPLEWEDAGISVKGHIVDVEDEGAMGEAYSKGRLFLHDIRNGFFLEVRVTGDKDAVFSFLQGVAKFDEVFIKGTAAPVIIDEDDECVKGLVVRLSSVNDMDINL